MEVIKELKLDKVDPTGVSIESSSLTYTINDEETMREFRFILTFGDHLYSFNKKGELINQIK